MADSQTATSQQQSEQQTQGQDHRDQSQFDTTFLQAISSGYGQQVDWAREYFDSIEQQVRSARRVAEVSALTAIQQQIVATVAPLVKQQVMAELRQNPSLLQGNTSR